MLREILPVYKREIKAYFHSPATYVALSLFIAFVGLNHFVMLRYFVQFSEQKKSQPNLPPLNLMEHVVSPLFLVVNFMMLFVVPILTMRLFSEEKRLGSFELLVTCPLRDWSILLGKFFAAVTVGIVALLLCLTYPLVLQHISGGEGFIEWPVVWVSFGGSALVIMAYIAFGTFASSVTENQMLAAILTFIGLLSFYLIGRMGFGQGKEWFDLDIGRVFDQISVLPHLENFAKGLVNLTDVAYFILFSVFFLILTSKILEARRWRV